ncbi:hypothetical protein Sjap_023918 [Stephania japonica]|uniref:Ribonuclease H1 N-terminal domain-containing protein n=1 Tax=Stephania japonica TaxID=461633 RepID=A0AAP0ECI4_9MAGN
MKKNLDDDFHISILIPYRPQFRTSNRPDIALDFDIHITLPSISIFTSASTNTAMSRLIFHIFFKWYHLLTPSVMAPCKKWYVVFKGRETGVFESWDACSRSVNGYSGNSYKSYQTLEEALFAYEKSLSGPQEPLKMTQIEGSNHERGDIELHATYAVPPPLPPLRWILEARRHKGLN